MMKLLNRAQLDALAAHCGHKHTTCAQQGVDEWVAQGQPATWHIAEESADGWAAAVDTGYGLLALFKGDKCLGVGKRSVHADPPEVILLDRDYYGLPNYLWRPANEVTGLREARAA